MAVVKLSRLYAVACVLCLASGGSSFCPRDRPHRTLCDSALCLCHDPYGRIDCSCDRGNASEVVVRSSGDCGVPPEASAIAIRDCGAVTIATGALDGLRALRSLELLRVAALTIQPHGLRWNETAALDDHGLRLNLTNVTLADLPSFAVGGRVDEVSFRSCYLGMIRAFAFSNLEHLNRVQFIDTNVANVEAQAFKKFSVSKFLMVRSRFNVIPSRFFVDMYVDDLFKIDGTFIDTIRTLAFRVHNPIVLVVTGSRINVVESEAFKVRTRGAVTFEGNAFTRLDDGAFLDISVERHVIQQFGRQKFKFVNNSVGEFNARALLFNATTFDVVVDRVSVDEPCSCDGLETWKNSMVGVESEQVFWCRGDETKETESYTPGGSFYSAHCVTVLSSIYFFVVIISATAACLIIVVLLVACYVKQRKKWKSVPTGQGSKRGGKKGKEAVEAVRQDSGKGMIVPDGRTYRETEFHVIVEKAEPLEEGFIPYRVTRDRSKPQVN